MRAEAASSIRCVTPGLPVAAVVSSLSKPLAEPAPQRMDWTAEKRYM